MEEVAHLVYKCAGHVCPVAMKMLLEKCTSHNVDVHNLKDCLQIACEAGGGECVRIILEHLTVTEGTYDNIADCICLSAQSVTDSCLKIQLLMNYIDTFCANIGNVPSHSQTLNRIFGVFTPLTRACEHGNLDTVKILIQKGADVNLEDGRGSTPLHTAVGLDNLACVTALLEGGALVNKRVPGLQPVLFAANRLDVVQKLVAAKCDIKATDEDGRSALHTVAGFNNFDFLKFLCNKGCNVDQKDEYGLTAYHVAAEYGDLDILKYLHKMHAKPTVDVDGLSVLHYACCSVNETMEKVQFLVDTVKVPLDTRDEDGRTALYPAVQTAGLEVVEFLVERGLSIRDRDKDGNTYLHAVFLRYEKSTHDELVTFLFKANLDPDLYNTRDGRTPLHLALDSGLWYFFEDHLVTLIDRTSNINHKDSEGRTPLHMAAYRDASWVVKRLLDKGADREIKDSEGCKAIDLVPEDGSGETMKALLSTSELPAREIVYLRQGLSTED
ncbi:putative ankyrin repeat protein RF_0381 [Haliotis rubra]|uniref:putative ankyrin repeat protein RF_0381 n=1 Tax=Haliotis rubra TaxID=36100 RepID=UPI001EE50B54|nr:putative ankyrin repeat protein RF_0381 [Haliotis rubra]